MVIKLGDQSILQISKFKFSVYDKTVKLMAMSMIQFKGDGISKKKKTTRKKSTKWHSEVDQAI